MRTLVLLGVFSAICWVWITYCLMLGLHAPWWIAVIIMIGVSLAVSGMIAGINGLAMWWGRRRWIRAAQIEFPRAEIRK